MSLLTSIYLEPGKAFEQLQEKPSWLLPALLVALSTGVFALLYFLRVDAAWFAGHQEAQMIAQRPEMTPQEVEAARAFMPSASTLAYLSPVMAVLVMAIVYALTALYYLLAGKVTGKAVGYKRGLVLTAWSAMPLLLGVVAGLVSMYTSSNQVAFESLQVFNVDPLFVQLEPGDAWFTLARSFSLLNFWCWALAAIGWKTWFRTGWGQAITVAVLPSLVIYGTMALFALI